MQAPPYNITVLVFGEERRHVITNWYIDDGVLFLEDESDPENVERWAYAQGSWHTFHMPRPSDVVEDEPDEEEDDEVPQFNWGGDDA